MKKHNQIKIRCNTEEQIPSRKDKQYKSAAFTNNSKVSLYAFTDIKHAISIVGPTNNPKYEDSMDNYARNSYANKKRRSHSAHLLKGNKFVNKLVDMSVLASELGGSGILTDENSSQSRKNRLKEDIR